MVAINTLPDGYDLVYKWFDHLKEKGHRISAYVVMPNHLHALIYFRPVGQSINTIIGNGKRFLTYDIIGRLRESNNNTILQQLSAGVSEVDKQKGQLHTVFEDSFDIKECYSLRFINQKLDYIHNNPLTKKWNLAVDTVSYEHSSARYYETGAQGIYPVTHFAEIIEAY